MNHIRWYDTNNNIKNLIGLIEQLPSEMQTEIAQDIIESVMKLNQGAYDSFINKFAKDLPDNFNRWYDQDQFLCSAVEMIKLLNEQNQSELIDEISTTVVQIITKPQYNGHGA